MDDIEILASPASPYSRKLIAALRYQRTPFKVFWGDRFVPTTYPRAKPHLLPTVFTRDGDGSVTATTDTTPLLKMLNYRAPHRSIYPPDPALAFINDLIEDFADEWLTKPMFHYRWSHDEDANAAGPLVMFADQPTLSESDAAQVIKQFSERQRGRLHVVGSNSQTKIIIEESFGAFLDAFDQQIRSSGYLFGTRPSAADFAIYGQLTQLAMVDPTPAELTRRRAPRISAWTMRVDDLSGLRERDTNWASIRDLAELRALLQEIGETYAPVMLANKNAFENGQETFEVAVKKTIWRQWTFKYQAKCLGALQQHHAHLSPETKARINTLLADTGCDALFEN